MTAKPLLTLLVSLCFYLISPAQDESSTLDKIANFPERFFSKINSKTADIESKLDRQTEKYLERLLKKEKKLRRQLQRTDSVAAAQTFGNMEQQYTDISNKIKSPVALDGTSRGQYLPYVDSLKTSLSFLDQNSQLIDNVKGAQGKIQSSLQQITALRSKLGSAEQVKQFIRQRKEHIRQTLSRYTNLPKGITKSYNDFSKEFFYYSQQLKEYKQLLNDPEKLTQKALGLLNKLPAFKNFMSKYSELAAIFGSPDNLASQQTWNGLQTRSQVQQLIQTRFASAGTNAQQVLQQNMQAAQQQLGRLKDKINKLGGGSSEAGMDDMPDFKPNNQKTKSFLQRLEIGTSMQNTKSNYYFPTTTDLGISIGYRLSDKSTIGIGGSYRIGWGKDIRHIQVSHQGMSVRSFIDSKLKGSFWLTGGYEQNQQVAVDVDGNATGQWQWRPSGMLGVSKVISLKTKFFTKTKIQLLWDFLSYQQAPRPSPIVFRIAYNVK